MLLPALIYVFFFSVSNLLLVLISVKFRINPWLILLPLLILLPVLIRGYSSSAFLH